MKMSKWGRNPSSSIVMADCSEKYSQRYWERAKPCAIWLLAVVIFIVPVATTLGWTIVLTFIRPFSIMQVRNMQRYTESRRTQLYLEKPLNFRFSLEDQLVAPPSRSFSAAICPITFELYDSSKPRAHFHIPTPPISLLSGIFSLFSPFLHCSPFLYSGLRPLDLMLTTITPANYIIVLEKRRLIIGRGDPK